MTISPTRAVELWEGLVRAHDAMTSALEREMEPEAGIPLAWHEVLMHLTRAEGGMLRFQDLARVSGITDSGASRRLEQMVKAGYIERHTCPTDRRGVFAHITDAGRQAFDRANKVFLRSIDRHFARHLEGDEADSLKATLSRLG